MSLVWQSVLFLICARVLRIPTTSVRTGLGMTGDFCRNCGASPGRAVGEIGEALPVADEASRFRGSAPIGGHDRGRQSVGTTVGNRRPLRTGY